MAETATATNPTEANASTEAPATATATAVTETGTPQQTQTEQGQQQTGKGLLTEAPAETPAATEKTEAAQPGAPEKYEFTAPEGTAYDPAVLEAFAGAAKEANLTQEAAQKLVEKMAPALAARQADQVKAVQTQWLEASKTDKEFGGENLPQNLGVARKALDAFATPELRTLLDQSGLANHPEMIRMFYRAGKAISEDTFVGGSAPKAGKSALEVLYPTTVKER